MTYKLTGRPILKGEKNVTIVTIEKEEPGRYSYERVELPGNRTQDNEEVLIQAALDHIRTELDPTSAIVKNQEQLAKTTEAPTQPTNSWMVCRRSIYRMLRILRIS